MHILNSRNVRLVGEEEDAVVLTSLRRIARNTNHDKLAELQGEEHAYQSELDGSFSKFKSLAADKLDDKLPAPYILSLKEGAKIVMLKNDSKRRWVNGSIGTVRSLGKDYIEVEIDNKTHEVDMEIWSDVRFTLNEKTKKIEEQQFGEFKQYPMRLAYAMTIHKSQGQSFDKVIIDIGRGTFAHGQLYVALSRCRSLEGLFLRTEVGRKDVIVDEAVLEYLGGGSGS